MVASPLQKYPSVGSSGPYRDPGIGVPLVATRYHRVSAAHGLHSVVDASWKFEIAFTQPFSVIEQGFVVAGMLYLLWFANYAICTITFIFFSSVM